MPCIYLMSCISCQASRARHLLPGISCHASGTMHYVPGIFLATGIFPCGHGLAVGLGRMEPRRVPNCSDPEGSELAGRSSMELPPSGPPRRTYALTWPSIDHQVCLCILLICVRKLGRLGIVLLLPGCNHQMRTHVCICTSTKSHQPSELDRWFRRFH